MADVRLYLGLGGPGERDGRARAKAIRICTEWLDGATFYDGEGLWKGELEPCMVIEVLGADPDLMRRLAAHLAKEFGQSCVIMKTYLGLEGMEFIGPNHFTPLAEL